MPLAMDLTLIPFPDHPQRMKYQSVSNRQSSWVGNGLVGVKNNWVARDAPVLVPDDSLAVFAGRSRMVAITVVLKSWDAVRHRR